MNEECEKEWISIGYRCTSASLLKKNGLKNASYPFDWMISRPSVIKHIIQTNFQEFMKLSNYKSCQTDTYAHIFKKNGVICAESIFSNQFYKLSLYPETENSSAEKNLQEMFYSPLSILDLSNTYHHGCALNHYNFNQRPEHYNYYLRCIERFQDKLCSTSSKSLFFLYISPVYPLSYFDKINQMQIDEIESLFSSLETVDTIKGGIIFLLYHSENDYPIFYDKQLLTSIKNKPISIFRIDCNRYLIDAGESFMGNYYREEQYISEIIKNAHAAH